jgi:hypothetical protein
MSGPTTPRRFSPPTYNTPIPEGARGTRQALAVTFRLTAELFPSLPASTS